MSPSGGARSEASAGIGVVDGLGCPNGRGGGTVPRGVVAVGAGKGSGCAATRTGFGAGTVVRGAVAVGETESLECRKNVAKLIG